MLFRKIVHAASEAPDRPLARKSVQGKVNRLAAPQIQEVAWDEYRTTTAAANPCKYSRINALRRLSQADHVRNSSQVSLQRKGLFRTKVPRPRGRPRAFELYFEQFCLYAIPGESPKKNAKSFSGA